MIKYGDYLLFDYDVKPSTVICKYITSDNESSYLQIIYNSHKWFTQYVGDVPHYVGDICKIYDIHLHNAYHYKTYADLVADII